MSTTKVINVIHPSGVTNNIVNDNAGNVTVGNNLTVAGTATVSGAATVTGNLTVTGTSTFTGNVGAITSTGSATATAFIPSGSTVPTNGFYLPAANTIGWSTNTTQVANIDSSGNFSFNSGYGSVATAYGCRAWVNFNGTSTVAIRASGNVTSITDNGTGDYTVNFTTAMPDANYAAIVNVASTNIALCNGVTGNTSANASYLTGSCKVISINGSGALADVHYINVSFHR